MPEESIQHINFDELNQKAISTPWSHIFILPILLLTCLTVKYTFILPMT